MLMFGFDVFAHREMPMKYAVVSRGGLLMLVLVGSVIAQVDRPASEARERVNAKTAKLLEVITIDDAAKRERVSAILGEWYSTLRDWHREHDAELASLWSEWSRARAAIPKDEFPGEVIAHQIDDLYASLKPEYASFIRKLGTELDSDQVDAIKERWSRSPGMTRTYNAYLEIAPDLTEEQKKVILDRMKLAREDAMLTDADREIVNIFKRHKVKVEQYIGTLQWAKLHKAFAEKGKSTTTQPATAPGQ